jgi:biotin operon repressor
MKQIFILERDELAALKNGEPLRLVLGDQQITIQADVVRRMPRIAAGGEQNGRRKWTMKNGGLSTTERVLECLQKEGPASCVEIAAKLDASRSAVASALGRFKGIRVRRVGKGRQAKWRIK